MLKMTMKTKSCVLYGVKQSHRSVIWSTESKSLLAVSDEINFADVLVLNLLSQEKDF